MAFNDIHQTIDPSENASSPGIAAGKVGSNVVLTINEPRAAMLINDAGFDRVILERSTDGGLSYEELTTPDARPVLEVGKSIYKLRDRAGDDAYWYRTRYMRSRDCMKSEASEPVIGAGLSIFNILSVEQLKQRYFFGVDITDDDGNELLDSTFQHYILTAIRWFEMQIDIPIIPTTFCEYHDFHRNDYEAWNFIRLDNYPVISVEEFRVEYPSGQSVIIYPAEWLRLNKPEGHIQIVPTAGTLSEMLIGQGGSFLPLVGAGQPYLPQLFRILYTAGFEDGKIPRNIVDVIGKFAALGPFDIFGDLIAGAGIATISLSMDGLSQNVGTTSSATNAGYGARIIQYTKYIKDQIPLIRRTYKGLRMVVA